MSALLKQVRAEISQIERTFRRRMWVWGSIMAVAWITAIVGAVMMGIAEGSGAVAPWLVAANVVFFTYLFGNLVPSTHYRRALKAAEARRLALVEKDRSPIEDSRSSWGDSNPVSLRQSQHAWYGGRSDLNWTDRVRAESMGLDADTYVNNVLEHDPN